MSTGRDPPKIAAVLAAMEGADPQRAAFLALWHDSQETRTTASAKQLAHEATTQNSLDWLERAKQTEVDSK